MGLLINTYKSFPRNTQKVIFFADYGDSGYTNHIAVGDKLVELNPDLLIHGGDTYETGTPASAIAGYSILQPIIDSQKFIHIQGDHDLEFETQISDLSLGSLIFNTGSTWNYFELSHGTPFPINWKDLSFDDSLWSSGSGLFGYGDVQNTVLDFGSDANDKYMTYLFRKVINSSIITSNGLVLELICDDGCEIYINGDLIYSFNMKYPITEESTALSGISTTTVNGHVYLERKKHIIRIPSSIIISGDNVISVLLKQDDIASSDIAFDLALHNYTFPTVGIFGSKPFWSNGYGDGIFSIAPYLERYLEQYTIIVGNIEFFFLTTGYNNSNLVASPSWVGPESQGASWLKNALSNSSALYKILITHETPVTKVSGKNRSYLEYLVNNHNFPLNAIIHGDVHVSECLTHNNGMVVADASNFPTISRSDSGSIQYPTPEDWTSDFFDGTNGNNLYLDIVQSGDSIMLNWVNISGTTIFTKELNQNIHFITQSRISSDLANVEEQRSTGSIDAVSSDLEFGEDSSRGEQLIGLQFEGLNIPTGVTINSAYVQFTCDEAYTGYIEIEIRGNGIPNPSAFNGTAYEVSSASATTASVLWTPPDWDVVQRKSTVEATYDLSTIIQEIIDRDGYNPTDRLQLYFEVMNFSTGLRRIAESYNGAAAGELPTLYVNYS